MAPSKPKESSALVVGGGIGGLTTAVTLRQAGYDVEVVEIKDDWTVADAPQSDGPCSASVGEVSVGDWVARLPAVLTVAGMEGDESRYWRWLSTIPSIVRGRPVSVADSRSNKRNGRTQNSVG